MTEMNKIMPEEIIPYSEISAALYFAKLFEDVGLPADVERREKLVIPGRHLTRNDYAQIARQYAQFFSDFDRAEEIFQNLIQENPTDIQAISELFGLYEISHQYEKAIVLLEDWLVRNPMDKNARRELERLQKLISSEQPSP